MAYKVFTNGSPLPASDLNTYLMNQSVMVFANSTARSAALTAPTEGMVTYLEDTNNIEVWTGFLWLQVGGSPITTQGDLIIGNSSGIPSRLALGTNGQVLTSNGTTAIWSAPGGLWSELHNGFTSAGGTTFNFTGLTARNRYKILGAINAIGTGNVDLSFRFNGTNSGYSGQGILWKANSSYSAASIFNGDGGPSSTEIPIGRSSTNTSSPITFAIEVEAAQSSGAKPWTAIASGWAFGGNSQWAYVSSGMWNNTSAISSLTWLLSGGAFNNMSYSIWGSN